MLSGHDGAANKLAAEHAEKVGRGEMPAARAEAGDAEEKPKKMTKKEKKEKKKEEKRKRKAAAAAAAAAAASQAKEQEGEQAGRDADRQPEINLVTPEMMAEHTAKRQAAQAAAAGGKGGAFVLTVVSNASRHDCFLRPLQPVLDLLLTFSTCAHAGSLWTTFDVDGAAGLSVAEWTEMSRHVQRTRKGLKDPTAAELVTSL